MLVAEAFCPQLQQEAMVPLLCWLNPHLLPVKGGLSGAHREWPMTTLTVTGKQKLQEWVTNHWQISQRATALPNETRNHSTILIPALLRSCSPKRSADSPFFLEAAVLQSHTTHVPEEEPWCPHPRHPWECSQVLGFIPQRYRSVQTFFTCSDHFSSLGTCTPPCHCPTN